MTAPAEKPTNVLDFGAARANKMLNKIMHWLENVELDENGQAKLDDNCPLCTSGKVNGPICAFHEVSIYLKSKGML